MYQPAANPASRNPRKTLYLCAFQPIKDNYLNVMNGKNTCL